MPDQVWAVKHAGRETQIRDLPVGVLADIAKKTEVSWLVIQVAPLMDVTVAEAVLRAVCDLHGDPIPDGLTGRTIMDYFVQVDDDLPTEFVDGVPPEAADL